MTTTMLTPAEAIAAARLARDLAINLTDNADTSGWDRKVIDQAIDAFARTGRPFSSNDIRPLLPEVRSSLIGARFMAASVQGRIRRIGLEPSTKKNTHAKDVSRWVGVRASVQAPTERAPA